MQGKKEKSAAGQKRLSPYLIALIVLSILSFSKTGFSFEGYDPWYVDADTHWAGHYIYVLWQEHVTDGWVSDFVGYLRAYFGPSDRCTRAQFLVLLAKVMSLTPYEPNTPSYPDVGRNYTICSYKPAFKWIETAVSAGISFMPKGRPFEPEKSITREDAVDVLIRCLDLYDHAQSLSQEEVKALLTQFYDGLSTSFNRRNTMACAIKYGIINGYEDDTLKPGGTLLRGEAAAIVFRSCLIRMNASKDVLTPDGDGIDDMVEFRLLYLRNRGITAWDANIQDAHGQRIFSFNPRENPGNPPDTLWWDGRNNNGALVPPGLYYYQATVRDRSDRRFFSVRKPLMVIRYGLSAYLFPSICRTGETLTIKARTEPSARSVYAEFQDNQGGFLYPDGTGTLWTLARTVDSSLPQGRQKVLITAYFTGATRNLPLEFTKEPDLWLKCSVSPDCASWGQRVTLTAETSPTAQSCKATLLNHTIVMTEKRSSESGIWWIGTFTIPHGTIEKDYAVLFTAQFPQEEVLGTCTLTVENSKLKNLLFTLTE